MRQRIRWTFVLLTAAMSAVMVIAMGGVAQAASGSASGTGASNSASWTWGTYSITGLSYRVSDTSCDSNDVYGYVEIYTSNSPNGEETTYRYNSSGCGTTVSYSGLSYSANFRINGLRVAACVDDAGSNTCYRSGYLDNPNT
ncbi:hypothetical protein [Streptomyces sp. MMBL 11-3]|uniref:hypothetical protein n=1 Tax=Streptomyces sp. MMBL 11-3 TaxID=3382639 RepID=UPI0039B3685A